MGRKLAPLEEYFSKGDGEWSVGFVGSDEKVAVWGTRMRSRVSPRHSRSLYARFRWKPSCKTVQRLLPSCERIFKAASVHVRIPFSLSHISLSQYRTSSSGQRRLFIIYTSCFLGFIDALRCRQRFLLV